MDILYNQLSSIFPIDRISIDETVLVSYSSDLSTPPKSGCMPNIVVIC